MLAIVFEPLILGETICMTKLGTIDFDDRIIDALRDNRLVIFAGAGVSMGHPSNLSSFWTLANDIAQGTGFTPKDPLDRFLGELHHHKVAVHDRAVKLLSLEGSAPNELHHNLLRLFRNAADVRLVTTNFDRHFVTAATELFNTIPDVYRAPALPRGYNFSGIVHVHGILPWAQDLVLTDSDFGKAYLTEGWARQFLVDVFHNYTVLFVGYSHDDAVMNYLARALPVERVAGRFALTDKNGNWDLLGITPIIFEPKEGNNSFQNLYDGVRRLADRSVRGALDWQLVITELCGRSPPSDTDEEAISEVEQALRELHTTRFLIDVARDPQWLHWLNNRKHLDAIFGVAVLDERDQLLIKWVVNNYVLEHSDEIMNIVATHGLKMHSELWHAIGIKLGNTNENLVDVSVLKRWISVLLTCAPNDTDPFVLMLLAERCATVGCANLSLTIFMKMSDYRLDIRKGFASLGHDSNKNLRLEVECNLRAESWTLNEVWTKHIKPLLPYLAQQLISRTTHRLEDIHSELTTWEKASPKWDPNSFRRSAIELNEQDKNPGTLDVLIDIARDSLEWLAENSPTLLGAWIETLVTSDVPLLRRLAVHSITVNPQRSPKECINWLLTHGCIYDISVHHEVFRAAALYYPDADELSRKSLVEAIVTHSVPSTQSNSPEKLTDRFHFDWLFWLLRAKPDCSIADEKIAFIKAKYPEWKTSDHPDFTHVIGTAKWVGTISPWSTEQILATSPREQLDQLLNFKDDGVDRPTREGLQEKIREACKKNTDWALLLGQILIEKNLWSSDLWPAIILGIQDSELSKDGWIDLLGMVSNPELCANQAHSIANLLYCLVRDDSKPFVLELLDQATLISEMIWNSLDPEEQYDEIDDSLTRAINSFAGVTVNFWIKSLSLLVHDKTKDNSIITGKYFHRFSMVLQDNNKNGELGRSLLTSNTSFLFKLNESWTCQHIIPLFSDLDKRKFSQAWECFLKWDRLFPALVETLLPAYISAISRLDAELKNCRQIFIKSYTSICVFHDIDPTQKLLPLLFKYSSLKDRLDFASHLSYLLRNMKPPAQQQLWERWLSRYWHNRSQGLLAALVDDEICIMLEWLPYLGDSYPDAVKFLVSGPTISLGKRYFFLGMEESDLIERFPTETVELLIYLSKCQITHLAMELSDIQARLPELTADYQHRLEEAFALAGVEMKKSLKK